LRPNLRQLDKDEMKGTEKGIRKENEENKKVAREEVPHRPEPEIGMTIQVTN